jgi:hypothetical protein
LDFWKEFVRVSDGKGGLVCPVPHREQQRVIAAVDARTPDGARTYPEVLIHWSKKSAKTYVCGQIGVHHLFYSGEAEGALIGIASSDEVQSGLIFGEARRTIERSPLLSGAARILAHEIVYAETRRDARTGARYTVDHIMRRLPRDVKGEHGQPWSLVLRDELWSEPDHSMSEALIPSPNRRHPLTVYASYSPTKLNCRPGAPLFDLLERVKAGDATVFYSHIGGTGDDAPWRVCPWITERWIESQRRLFAASPSRFRRVILNEVVAGDGDGLLSHAELSAMVDTQWAPSLGAEIVVGLDLGLSNDHAALVAVRLDGMTRKAVVESVKVWKGTTEAPVDLTAVESAVLDLARRYRITRMVSDAWQSALMVQRLSKAGVFARTQTITSAVLDAVVTILKRCASNRLLTFGAHETDLAEQLEAVKTIESRRRGLVKFAPSGSGPDASAHDDIVFALGLALIELEQRGSLGQTKMAEQSECYEDLRQPGALGRCYLAHGNSLPIGPCCQVCPGNVSTRAALDTYNAQHLSETLDLRNFVAAELIKPNRVIAGARVSRFVDYYL